MKHVELFTLNQGFGAPACPGHHVSCSHHALTDHALAPFKELTDRFNAERIDGPRPADKIVSRTGRENRSLRCPTVAEEVRFDYGTDRNNGLAFATRNNAVPAAVTQRHDFAAVFAG